MGEKGFAQSAFFFLPNFSFSGDLHKNQNQKPVALGSVWVLPPHPQPPLSTSGRTSELGSSAGCLLTSSHRGCGAPGPHKQPMGAVPAGLAPDRVAEGRDKAVVSEDGVRVPLASPSGCLSQPGAVVWQLELQRIVLRMAGVHIRDSDLPACLSPRPRTAWRAATG